MLSIRLSRVGKNKKPQYRIVVMDKKKDPWANNLGILGQYDPASATKKTILKEKEIKYWLSKGAKASPTVHNILVENKILEGKKVHSSSISKKRAKKINENKKVDNKNNALTNSDEKEKL